MGIKALVCLNLGFYYFDKDDGNKTNSTLLLLLVLYNGLDT